MTNDETEAFLLEGSRTGKLAWVSKDGSPHVAPIWFLLDGRDIIFMTGTDSGKARALTRTGRASMVVDLEEAPYAFVKIDGTVTVTENDPDLLEWATKIGGRYMGADRAEEFGKRNAVPEESLLRLTPERVTALTDVSG
jgi:PPOX class probable F420-dependent enzyme